ncbi:MFS transporter [Leptobacterium flavescens]|uniref:MFS transporter n=1 Tax=Leptobacterium flavescens TaxID=472055 RepID=A0A6P0UP70_9FLAO|nr:peptide MFS transporter [Leptobacterium flavescens]NER14787.1 MFS transporter [Leptobacterium flavescens]
MSSAISFGGSKENQKTLLGHPVGLFVLFFTEMWERFSYTGMRAILVLFLISETSTGGFAWSRADALVLYAIYTGAVYLTPIIGGWIADQFLGSRNSVIIGALLMTIGHAILALETEMALYTGIGFLIIGTGFFKPSMTPILGEMYPDKNLILKDAAYTIFYMGVNAGYFVGIIICGWLGTNEKFGWSWGFGAAGLFMFLGMLQFYFARKIFGDIGSKPNRKKDAPSAAEKYGETEVKFTKGDSGLLGLSVVLGILTTIGWNVFELDTVWKKLGIILPFIISILSFIILRLKKYPTVERNRLTVVAVLSFFIVFFWLAFEQAGGTMTIFAEDYTQRSFTTDASANTFRTVSLILTIIPMLILTYVFILLSRKIAKAYPLSVLFLGICFVIIWIAMGVINYENFHSENLEVPTAWFGTLNAFFIISLAPLFSKMWKALNKNKIEPSGPIKFAMGLFLLGIGFVMLAIGASSIPAGAKTASVSMVWLILAYFFHTVGELAISPVGLSYVNKLSPKRIMALMFGVFYLANFIANFTGGIIGSYIDDISKSISLSGFFSIFVYSSFGSALLLILLNKKLRKLMHGIH